MKNERHMKAIIFAAPSGSGKTTLVKHLLANNSDLQFSISATTRDRRNENEQYYFMSVEEFRQKIDNDEFIEWQEVYPGKYYGTLKTEIERIWALGKNIVFDVDVQGGISLKKIFGDYALSVFVKVPSLEVLKQRLISRDSETEESLKIRLDKIEHEMTFQDQYQHRVFNDDLEKSCRSAQWFYDMIANEVTFFEPVDWSKEVPIFYKGDKYLLKEEKIKTGDLYYLHITNNVSVMKDVNYGHFNPNKLGALKLKTI